MFYFSMIGFADLLITTMGPITETMGTERDDIKIALNEVQPIKRGTSSHNHLESIYLSIVYPPFDNSMLGYLY